MKNLLIAFCLVPTISFANIYSCNGAGFLIELTGSPMEMKVSGNGLNAMAQNVRASSTFDTVITGNIMSPASTIKLTIKDASFGNPGDRFNAGLQVSSSIDVKTYNGIICIRGNE